eukprot:9131794-Lingulodinium_polyedra.AAC.1
MVSGAPCCCCCDEDAMMMAAAGTGARQGRLGAGVGPAQSCEPARRASIVHRANIVSADVFSKERG